MKHLLFLSRSSSFVSAVFATQHAKTQGACWTCLDACQASGAGIGVGRVLSVLFEKGSGFVLHGYVTDLVAFSTVCASLGISANAKETVFVQKTADPGDGAAKLVVHVQAC